MDILFSHSKKIITYNDRIIGASCNVRTIDNGKRKHAEIVYSIPDKKPYMPAPFPVGRWQVLRPKKTDDPIYAPYFIPTTAFQMLPVWKVIDKRYYWPLLEMVKDTSYGLHHSTSNTTWGCIRIDTAKDAEFLALEILAAMQKGEKVWLNVER